MSLFKGDKLVENGDVLIKLFILLDKLGIQECQKFLNAHKSAAARLQQLDDLLTAGMITAKEAKKLLGM